MVTKEDLAKAVEDNPNEQYDFYRALLIYSLGFLEQQRQKLRAEGLGSKDIDAEDIRQAVDDAYVASGTEMFIIEEDDFEEV